MVMESTELFMQYELEQNETYLGILKAFRALQVNSITLDRTIYDREMNRKSARIEYTDRELAAKMTRIIEKGF